MEPETQQPEDAKAVSGEESVEPALPAELERPTEEGDPNGQPV